MKANRVFFSGIFAGLLLTLLTVYFRGVAGWIEWNFEMLVGTLFVSRGDINAWIIGMVGHLLLAGGFALLYGLLFEKMRRAGVFMGLFVGLLHALVIGVLLVLFPLLHNLLSTGLETAPGIFASNYGGSDVLVFFLMHLLYGSLLGGLYGRPLSAGDPGYEKV